jgi:chromosome segregation ATPase
MTTPTDAKKIVDAAHEARDALNAARQRAIELLNPDPVEVLADVIADRDAAIAERDKHSERRNAMSADLDAIHGMVGRPELPIVEAVCAMADQVKALRADLDALRKEHVQATETIEHLRERRRELKDEVDRLTTSLSTAEADAETQRTAAADLRASLDRVATAAGVDTEGDGFDVADRVIAVIRKLLDRPRMTETLPPPTSRPAALPADLRTYLETRRDRLQGGHGLAVAAEIAALNRWLALPVAEVSK